MNAFIRYCATRTASAATISPSPACREIHFRAQKYEKSSYKYCIVSFFSSASPACLIAARCIGHRTALQHPSHRAASATAPHSSKYSTSPRRLPHPAVQTLPSPRRTLPNAPPHSPLRPSAFSPAPLRTCPMAFPEISKPALSPFPTACAIYIMCRKQNCTFLKKKGHNALPICQIALPLQSQNGNKGCQARQNTPGSTLDA